MSQNKQKRDRTIAKAMNTRGSDEKKRKLELIKKLSDRGGTSAAAVTTAPTTGVAGAKDGAAAFGKKPFPKKNAGKPYRDKSSGRPGNSHGITRGKSGGTFDTRRTDGAAVVGKPYNTGVLKPASVEMTGKFSYSGRGFGFCVPDRDSGLDDVFIPPRATMGAMTGDRVTVRVRARIPRPGEADDGRKEGEVIAVAFSQKSIIGILHVARGYSYVVPDSRRYGVNILVSENDALRNGALDGYKVEVIPDGEEFFTRTRSISVKPGAGDAAERPYFDTRGKISRVFGDGISKDANYAAILYASGIKTAFPEATLAHADAVSAEPVVMPSGNSLRADLRDKIIFTIDGAGAKDLDDAVSLEKSGENYVLGVHIADVSHYVRQGTPTEEEARERGTSVYFTDKVVPMLPESLSNRACSLNAGEDKYALTAELTLDKNGRRISSKVFKSVIKSAVRGVYSEVNSLIESGKSSEFYEKYAAVYPMLCEMRTMYEKLKALSVERGIIELEDSEAVILLDESGFPAEIVRRERGDAERMIEQFMLQANMGVAEVLKSNALPCLYRVHEDPSAEKISRFAIFVNNLGISLHELNAKGDMTSRAITDSLSQIMADANEKNIGGVVSNMLLRSMMKAKYQSECARHFGLGADVYCHFTSPIRRYPDLFVHSVLTAVLEAQFIKTGAPVPYLTENSYRGHGVETAALGRVAAERGTSSSDCEVRAEEAERSIDDMYMTLYMTNKIGEEFDVVVSSVIRSGMFVQCDNLIEGFVPLLAFPGAKVNEAFMTVAVGSEVLTLGSRMKVKLEEADVASGKITFSPVR